ncbi:MAG: aminopeptidase P family protein [Anaerolineae bacterium]|nr:aminopeptidase P family protein [Anaerolineae bacterium]
MKADLDRLMAEREIDALFTLNSEHEDPYRTYLANGADFSGMVFKKRGEAPVLISGIMEIDEAAKSGLTVYSMEDFKFSELAKEHKEDRDAAFAGMYRNIFAKLDISGKVAIYGVGDLNVAFGMLRALEKHLGDVITLVTEPLADNIFDRAYETKDPDEIARLRAIAKRTSAVVRDTRAWLGTMRAAGDAVVQPDGTPLTIGDVKRYVRGKLYTQNLEDVRGMIFAQGRDAGVPHSAGEDDQTLQTGQAIVFDLFPREPKGYFHDMTRTWCLGHAPDEVQAVYDTVMEVFDRSFEMCKPGLVTSDVQRMVCEFFEERGHPTGLNTPGTAEGYVHSLAHGIGLNVHEAPYFRTHGGNYHIQPGNVFTIEPGLYYPEKGYGVRIEDTVIVNDDGTLESLTDVPYDLVIELAD